MANDFMFRELIDDLQHRRVDRRQFIERAAAIGIGARGIAALLGMAGVAAPVGMRSAMAQQAGGTVGMAMTSDPETLDPHVTSNSVSWTVFDRIYGALVYQDIDLTYKGELADSWEISEDNKEVTFTLKDGVTFHNGEPFNAESVKYTFDRLASEGEKSPIYEMIAAIKTEVVDDLTVKVTFDSPNAAFFNGIAGGYGGMLNQKAVDDAGGDYGRQPVGTNSYKLKDWRTGTEVLLESFADFKTPPAYYENTGAPYISEIAYKVIPEAFAQIASLETGEIDMVGLSATDLPRFENDDRFQIFESQNASLQYLGLTRTRPMMEDPNVRKALAHAIDRDEIVSTLFEGGLAQACYTPLPPSVPGYDERLEETAPHLDLEEAARLLDEAGWVEGDDGIREKDGQRFAPALYTNTSTTSGQLATLIQAQLRKVGCEIEINQLETAALLDFTPRGEHDMLLLSWGWSDPDVLHLFLSTDRIETSNRVHYSNPDFDEILVEGQQTLDQEARMEVYYRAQEILIEDLPWIPLFMPITKTAVAARLKDVDVFPTGGILLHDAYIE